MKVRKYQGGTGAGGFNQSISSFTPQMVPNVTNPYSSWFNQSLTLQVPKFQDYFKKKSTFDRLTDPSAQFKANYPNLFGKFTPPAIFPPSNSNVNLTAPTGTVATGGGIAGPTGSAGGAGGAGGAAKTGLGASGIGQLADIGSALLGPTNSDPTTQTVNAGYDLLSDVAMKANPLIGAIMKGADFLQSGLNKLTRGYTTVENSKYGFDKVMSGIPILGMLNAFGKSSIAGSNTDIAKTIDMGYTPADEVKKSQIGSGTKFFAKIFGGKNLAKEQKNLVQRTDVENIKKSAVVGANKEWLRATQNSAPNVLQRNLDQLAGGYSPQTMKLLAAKRGTKLFHLSNIKNEVTRKLQRGGTMNVIPDGAFHSRKNNIDLDGITHKGIPVVTMEEGGEVTQHAEIEREELIFRKELTEIVEEAYKKYKEGDESVLLELGKLLTYEILENTEDNVGLLETVQ